MRYKLLLIALVILIAAYPVQAAKISGRVYDYRITPLTDVISFVDSEPVQRYVVSDGTYYFELPAGTYTIIARTFNDPKNVLGTNEIVDIKDEGSFIFDLILAPVGPGDTTIITKDPADELKGVLNPFKYKDILKNPTAMWILLAAAATIAGLTYILIIMYKRIRRLKKNALLEQDTTKNGEYVHTMEENISTGTTVILEPMNVSANKAEKTAPSVGLANPEPEKYLPKPYEPADDAAKAVLDIIKNEKRITQKDIRKQLPDSEAKISLVISELESKGIVKKIKKGRGNIIIYVG
jgi:uncharacterized membrane protein